MSGTLQLTAPSSTDKYFIQESYGGYNKCILISGNSVLHNCTGFAYGCFMKAAGKKSCVLPTSMAENWYQDSHYDKGFEPKVGGIMVWLGGSRIHYSEDGMGHVAFVIRVKGDKVTVIEDGYFSKRIRTLTLSSPYNYGSMKYLGCVYNPNYKPVVMATNNFKVGKTYTLTSARKVRAGSKTTSRVLKYEELTKDGKKHAVVQKNGASASLAKGTKVTIMRLVTSGDKVFAKIPSGWITVISGKNKYAK